MLNILNCKANEPITSIPLLATLDCKAEYLRDCFLGAISTNWRVYMYVLLSAAPHMYQVCENTPSNTKEWILLKICSKKNYTIRDIELS